MKLKPILGIDASRANSAHPTGVERYSQCILKALLDSGVDTRFRVRLYTPSSLRDFLPYAEALEVRMPFPRLWTLLRLSYEMLRRAPDMLFIPSHVLPFFAPKRSFVMIHDVAFCRHPTSYGFFQRIYLSWSTRRAVRLCERVLVPTQSVARDLVHFFKAKAEHIVVIPHGPIRLSSSDATPLPPAPSKTPLFFYVGRLDKKKNLSVLLKAWPQVLHVYPQARLVFVGRTGDDLENLKQLWAPFGSSVEHRIQVSDSELASLYRSAHALVYPSLDEGFGFPLLEAFQENCPVICSRIPALEEVGAKATVLCEADEPDAFAQAMLRLASNHQEANRLRHLGQERVQEFAWEKSARKLISVLDSDPDFR